MAKPPLNSNELLALDTEHWDDESLVAYFRAHLNSADLDAWLLSPRRRGTLRGQLLLRCARMAAAYHEGAGATKVLIGLPMVFKVPLPDTVDWGAIRHELEAGIGYALAAEPVAAESPQLCSQLHQVGATQFSAWMAQLLDGAQPPLNPPPVKEGAYVWVMALSVDSSRTQELENLFFRVNPSIAQLTRILLMRLEGLLEEQGVAARLFPPTALWNSMSLARIAHARVGLQELQDPRQWSLQFKGGVLSATSQASTLNFEFPEEVAQDVEPVLGWFKARAAQ